MCNASHPKRVERDLPNCDPGRAESGFEEMLRHMDAHAKIPGLSVDKLALAPPGVHAAQQPGQQLRVAVRQLT